jgi:hypothetical protein
MLINEKRPRMIYIPGLLWGDAFDLIGRRFYSSVAVVLGLSVC